MSSGYAQTNLQLFNQLYSAGYASAELNLIRAAYKLSMHLFSGYYIVSGRTQIAHVVGTASILGTLKVSAEMVAAGLLHNVYMNGDFGDGRRGLTRARRRQVQSVVGEVVEVYVSKFPEARSVQTIPILDHHPEALDPVVRQVLLLRLADALDHALHCEYANRQGTRMVALAKTLGFPSLASELTQAWKNVDAAEARQELAVQHWRYRAGVIVPKSYGKRFGVMLRLEISRGFRQIRLLSGAILRFRRRIDRGRGLGHWRL